MSEGLLTCESLSWVHLEKPNHQLEGLLGQTGHVALLESLRLGDLGELKADETRVLVERLHLLLGEWTQYFLDEIELVHLRIAGEEGLPVGELTHDAADSPHINFRAIVSVA